MDARTTTPKPLNEPVLSYLPQSTERQLLVREIDRQVASPVEVPVVIGGRPVHTGKTLPIVCPHAHHQHLGKFHQADRGHAEQAIQNALAAAPSWAELPYNQRAAIFLKAAEKISQGWRYTLNAATMLGQSKTAHQAEIDSTCELADFFRFNVAFQEELYAMQPLSLGGNWNQMEYRPLEGFVFAVTPFNFTAIAGNLPTVAALMGNVVIWKPASSSILSSYWILKLLEECGLPPGVIQFLPGPGAALGEVLVQSPHLAGIHFTGSSATFQSLWQQVGNGISRYRSYPRLVGETGGKDFVFAHPSADSEALVANLVRGAFEYQGQKCSAASRAYIPRSLWKRVSEHLVAEVQSLKMGDVREAQTFLGAVIDAKSFENIEGYLQAAHRDSGVKILTGGKGNREVGYFIPPTVLEVEDPQYRTMCEEIFGPVLSVYVYEDNRFEETLALCEKTSPYALTGAFFAQDRKAIAHATQFLRHAAGNFYINSKPTGAVVGQQPFGGARASGTNDKAGSIFNLLRWTSLRTISETLSPVRNYRYPWLS